MVHKFGGQNTVNHILKLFEVNQNTYKGYFLTPRLTGSINQARGASVLWNFLYNLGVKHLSVTRSAENPYAVWTELVSLAQQIGSAIDVEQYIIWENVHISHSNINEVLLDNLHFDELFVIPQWGGDKASALFGWWIDALVDVGCQLPLVSPQSWKDFGCSLLSRAFSYKTLVVRQNDRISSSLSKEVVKTICTQAVIRSDKINSGFVTPFDISYKNAGDFPLWDIGKGVFLVPPRSIAARALYQNIYALMRRADVDGRLEDKLGRALERLSSRVLQEHGEKISVQSGKYRHSRLNRLYEIDIAIETEPRIILVECKKKALTDASRTGNIPATLIDLSKSVVHTLEQMARHEIHLRDVGEVKCLNGQNIVLGSRSIERISVGFLDHGALQGRVLLENLIKTLMFSTVGTADPTVMKELQKVNARILNLKEYLTSLAEIDNEEISAFLHSWFFGNWWLSVDQLAIILDEGRSLWDALMRVRNIMFGTGGVLTEFSGRAKMEARAAAEAANQV